MKDKETCIRSFYSGKRKQTCAELFELVPARVHPVSGKEFYDAPRYTVWSIESLGQVTSYLNKKEAEEEYNKIVDNMVQRGF